MYSRNVNTVIKKLSLLSFMSFMLTFRYNLTQFSVKLLFAEKSKEYNSFVINEYLCFIISNKCGFYNKDIFNSY